MVSKDILAEVAAERERQDGRWGGAEHDDEMTMDAFAQLIADYAGWARVKAREGTFDEARQRLVQAAALAVAAVECLDREKAQRDAPPAKPLMGFASRLEPLGAAAAFGPDTVVRQRDRASGGVNLRDARSARQAFARSPCDLRNVELMGIKADGRHPMRQVHARMRSNVIRISEEKERYPE